MDDVNRRERSGTWDRMGVDHVLCKEKDWVHVMEYSAVAVVGKVWRPTPQMSDLHVDFPCILYDIAPFLLFFLFILTSCTFSIHYYNKINCNNLIYSHVISTVTNSCSKPKFLWRCVYIYIYIWRIKGIKIKDFFFFLSIKGIGTYYSFFLFVFGIILGR